MSYPVLSRRHSIVCSVWWAAGQHENQTCVLCSSLIYTKLVKRFRIDSPDREMIINFNS
jgi:hypothetical protein